MTDVALRPLKKYPQWPCRYDTLLPGWPGKCQNDTVEEILPDETFSHWVRDLGQSSARGDVLRQCANRGTEDFRIELLVLCEGRC